MERFTVRIEIAGEEFINKFEQMEYAKQFSTKAIHLKGNETCDLEIIDNKVDRVPYVHYQINGKVTKSNLINRSVSSYFQD